MRGEKMVMKGTNIMFGVRMYSEQSSDGQKKE